MGVRSLWKILKPSMEKTTPSGIKLAVDTSIWICQYGHLGSDDIIYFFSKRIIKLLYHGIQPVFVFDGKPPEIKKHAILERRKRSNRSGIETVDKMLKWDENLDLPSSKAKAVEFGKDRYNWGDIFDSELDSHLLEYSTSSDEEVSSNEREENSLELDISFDFVESKDLSRTQKLRRLVDLRGRRKEIRTRCNFDDPDTFSMLQIKNLKIRNLISHNIKALEKKGYRRVHGDCKAIYKLTKKPDYVRNEGETTNELKKPTKRVLPATGPDLENDISELVDETCVKNNLSVQDLASYPVLKSLVDKYKDSDRSLKKDTECIQGVENYKEEKVALVSGAKERMMGGFFGLDGSLDSWDTVQEEYGSFYKGREIPDETNQGIRDICRVMRLIKDILEVFNISYVEAPSEADAQCGFMCRNNTVDGVITEDNDVLLYGGTVYRNFFRRDRGIEKYSLERIKKELNLDRKNLIELSYLLGSDYTLGVKGIGPVKALEAVRKGSVREEDIGMLVGLYLNPVAIDMKDILIPVVDKDKIRMFYEKKGLSKERIDGVMFFLERIKFG
ncbi:Rad2 [Encephalitozoon intestinalis ATCC 50506]|uniref:Rad2 n=1 Tax=Encephalitozoon intestinalis (strain ATCC 50506) TaxID=876142 RepID=E0S935_ENCIT|nr:Rad2 [Encephalitozoon intestinalis ATCC 50506]ADM12291.1 Rad2 [Encephalitozoon intestinalis ATCC 50506]UTX46101.1 DNA repair protein RAD2 [Encephalitozoon intestinalis]